MLAPIVALLLVAAPAAKPRLIILDLQAAAGVDPSLASVMTEAVTTEVERAGYFDAVSSADVRTLVGLERQKQMLGCSDEEAASCLAELGGAIGARFVMSGSLAVLGDAYQLSLQVLDSSRATPVGRTTRLAKDLKILRGLIPYAVADATGTPAPPPPSRVVPYSLMGGGAALIVGAAVLGLDGFAREREVNRELDLGEQNREVLQPLDQYREAATIASVEKSLALLGLLAGGALIGGGIYINGQLGTGDLTAALVPSARGFALVGTF